MMKQTCKSGPTGEWSRVSVTFNVCKLIFVKNLSDCWVEAFLNWTIILRLCRHILSK